MIRWGSGPLNQDPILPTFKEHPKLVLHLHPQTNSTVHLLHSARTYSTMSCLSNNLAVFLGPQITPTKNHKSFAKNQAAISRDEKQAGRRKVLIKLLASSVSLGVLNCGATPWALAESWGTRSFIREKFFEPDLSPEDSAARIKQTAEGLHSLREMLDTMSWRYVLFYIRLKAAYLSKDMKIALQLVPQASRKSYVAAANELVDNMSEGYEDRPPTRPSS